MTKSPILNFLMGTISGGMLATILVLHIVTNQVQAHAAEIGDSFRALNEKAATREGILQQTANAWQGRAEKCETKFTVGTIVYQPQAAASLPLLHGMASLELAPGSGTKASLYIPAQVDIYTYRSDVRYEWIDGRTGQSHGNYAAKSPAEAQ